MREFFYQLWQVWGKSNLPGIIGAVIVMLLGWWAALYLGGKTAKAARKCIETGRKISGAEALPLPPQSGSWAGRCVFYAIMLLALLAAMSLLKLEYAAVPLREFATAVMAFLPNIAAALLLWAAAWIIAAFVRSVGRRFLENSALAERWEKHFPGGGNKAVEYTVHGMSFVVYLFFLPAILNALEIYGITEPLQKMFAAVMIYLPRIVAAAVVFWVGLWAAKTVKKAVTAIALALRIDILGKYCGLKDFQMEMPAKFLGAVAWVLIAFPVVIAALNILGIEALSILISDFAALLLAGAGSIIGAMLILLAAWLIGRVCGYGVKNIIAGCGGDSLMEKIGFRNGHFQDLPLSVLCGRVVQIAAVIFGIISACDLLGFAQAALLFRQFAVFGGNLILSVIILLAGVALADFTAGAIREKAGNILTAAVKTFIVIFAAAMALSNLKLGNVIVENAFTMLLGAVCVAFAIAFGLGGREFAGKLLESCRWKKEE